MSIIEILLGMKGGPLNAILKIVTDIRAEQAAIAKEDAARFDAIDKQLKAISDQIGTGSQHLASFGFVESKPRKI